MLHEIRQIIVTTDVSQLMGEDHPQLNAAQALQHLYRKQNGRFDPSEDHRHFDQ